LAAVAAFPLHGSHGRREPDGAAEAKELGGDALGQAAKPTFHLASAEQNEPQDKMNTS
jgi:hypothetical protein